MAQATALSQDDAAPGPQGNVAVVVPSAPATTPATAPGAVLQRLPPQPYQARVPLALRVLVFLLPRRFRFLNPHRRPFPFNLNRALFANDPQAESSKDTLREWEAQAMSIEAQLLMLEIAQTIDISEHKRIYTLLYLSLEF
ncbi:hypothetical protein PHISCL_08176 [Aspergillus sclerotialis]|uniref:Uncharacterized protein n=1 Tax=Aspergillus sclerotialis TaxID=2070753 RepID=A0A3A2ZQX8_9EURO|nr:hypothetical protein PHISCL_08176 [Aspergillus sclerotialis]